ncbi:MAG: polyribonucleotide nucleotidyltransferase [candidate division Zixibacteria bacterium]|nr:polyribonucleotide nucleotidyltransferase [candidate division Zixibacteria bacterium]
MQKFTMELGGRELSIEVGRVARQADGACWVRFADTVTMATVCAADKPDFGKGFFPLSVDYREKTYAAGKIPGGFFKREGRPSEKETLTSRLIDRPLRPMFPEDFMNEVQVMVQVLSADQENDGDVLGIVGAAVALAISDIPFEHTIAGVRVGLIDGEYIVNPTFSQLEDSVLNLIVAGTPEHIIMVEGGCSEITEEEMVGALAFGHEQIRQICGLIKQIQAAVGKAKKPVQKPEIPDGLFARVESLTKARLIAANDLTEKHDHDQTVGQIIDETKKALEDDFPDCGQWIFNYCEKFVQDDMRMRILKTERRLDARDLRTIRPITCEVGVLPRTHGSALFTRGQTQALVVTTLGTKMDEQIVDALEGESKKSYMLHYNFPPFSTGEVKPNRGPGRREIGHGALAERSLEPVLPAEENFPYTIRIVSDIMESNGSSSMASVCGGSLSLMDAGVPIKAPVAGIAMGLILEGSEYKILTDILGAEDHYGDMDFKVAGTRDGITAFQLDIKIGGLTIDIMRDALARAKEARLKVLDTMDQTIAQPRADISMYAPRIITIKIKQDRIGEVIGPGGKMIRSIIEATGAKIDIDDDGTVVIASVDGDAGLKARDMILALVEEPEVDKIYTGKVKRIAEFGAFVEIIPNTDGLLHVSEIAHHRVEHVEDVLKVGDMIEVKVLSVDADGKIRLSKKALTPRPEGMPEYEPRGERRPHGSHRGGDRDRRPRDNRDRGRRDRD